MNKPSLPRGTRDFGPLEMKKRNYILSKIKTVFENHGFQNIETPSLENLSVLLGKYGDEGDKLIFKILNSGDFLSKTNAEDYNNGSMAMSEKIAEKGLRYDLTVPFARFVAMNKNEIIFPFKRYQIQPVWRADRPQKGRYREFYQCDVDIIGSDSLLNEIEVLSIITEVYDALGLKEYTICINHRKILKGISEVVGQPDQEGSLAIALDKLDKIGPEKVIEELQNKNFSKKSTDDIYELISKDLNNEEIFQVMNQYLQKSEAGLNGLKQLEYIYDTCSEMGIEKIRIDIALARGLSYYTGSILEVKPTNVEMGTITAGGRYDDLTGVFGLKDMSGLGISFGLDRIYDVLNELNLFPSETEVTSKILITNIEESAIAYALNLLKLLRNNGIVSEMYPEFSKLKKQLNYADRRKIPYVGIIGDNEFKNKTVTIKNMFDGEQSTVALESVVAYVNKS